MTSISGFGLSLLAAATLVLVACGRGDDDLVPEAPAGGSDATVASGTAAAGGGGGTSGQATAPVRATQAASNSGGSGGTGCEGTISGDVTGSFKSGAGASAVNTDYWFSEADLIQGGRLTGDTDAQVKAKIDAKQFVFYPLVLNCGDSKTGVNFLPKADAHSDFPFGPKTYTIPPGGPLGRSANNGEITVLILINNEPYSSKGGTLEVKKFDKSGISGSFTIDVAETFTASGAAKTGTIVGTFNMPCTGSGTGSGCVR